MGSQPRARYGQWGSCFQWGRNRFPGRGLTCGRSAIFQRGGCNCLRRSVGSCRPAVNSRNRHGLLGGGRSCRRRSQQYGGRNSFLGCSWRGSGFPVCRWRGNGLLCWDIVGRRNFFVGRDGNFLLCRDSNISLSTFRRRYGNGVMDWDIYGSQCPWCCRGIYGLLGRVGRRRSSLILCGSRGGFLGWRGGLPSQPVGRWNGNGFLDRGGNVPRPAIHVGDRNSLLGYGVRGGIDLDGGRLSCCVLARRRGQCRCPGRGWQCYSPVDGKAPCSGSTTHRNTAQDATK